MQTWVLVLLLMDDLLAQNRAMGIIRRRNLPVGSISLGPAARPGMLRLSCAVSGDRAAADRTANALRKMVGVQEVELYPEGECDTRDHALVRVKVAPAHLCALLDTVALYEARILEENPHELLIEATGTGPFMVSFQRALEPFGILDLARGATLALPRFTSAAVPAARSAAVSRAATAIPA